MIQIMKLNVFNIDILINIVFLLFSIIFVLCVCVLVLKLANRKIFFFKSRTRKKKIITID